MASASAAGPIADADIITCTTIVPRKVLARLQPTPPRDESAWIAQDVAAINERIDKDPHLSEPQKQDLKNLIKFSPNMAHTLSMFIAPTTKIFDVHLVCSVGFQFFIDGGRGKGGNGSQTSSVATFEQQRSGRTTPAASLGRGPTAYSLPSAPGPAPGPGMQPASVTSRAAADMSLNPLETLPTVGAPGVPPKTATTAMPPVAASSQHPRPAFQRPAAGIKRNASDTSFPRPHKRKMSHVASAHSGGTQAASIKTGRDTHFSDKLKKRSGLQCELSGLTEKEGIIPEGAHIFGLATATDGRADYFWRLLNMFWGATAVDGLRAACRKDINHMANGILMDGRAHRLWDKLHFYLEVVDDSYQVSGKKAQYTVKMRFPRTPIALFNAWRPWTVAADGIPEVQWFREGDEVIFKTDNYHDCPLPDPVLLKIRELVTRCAFLYAGGETDDVYLLAELRQKQSSAELRASVLDHGDDTFSEDDDSEYGSFIEEVDDRHPYEQQQPDLNITDGGFQVESWLDNLESNLVEGDPAVEYEMPLGDGRFSGYEDQGDA